jgi:hypothetical protein
MNIDLAAPTVLLQWAVGGLLFLWVTTRRREVGLGYGWLLRATYAVMAMGCVALGIAFDVVLVRELSAVGVVVAAGVAQIVSWQRRKAGVLGQQQVEARRSARVAAMTGIDRDEQQFDRSAPEFPPNLDLIAPIIGVVGLIAAGVDAGDPVALSVARVLVGAAFLGVVSDAMLLGHWYLVQPGLPRRLLNEIVTAVGWVWPVEIIALLLPVGMASVWVGTVDDGWNGTLGWFWAASAITTIVLVFVTRAALREREYSAVMAATGLLYLAILTAFGTDIVARAVLDG